MTVPQPLEVTEPDARLDPIIAALAEARLRRRLSQRAVAELVGTKQSSVSDWESGVSSITLPSLRRYCAALGIELCVQDSDTPQPLPWLELARRNTKARRTYENLAESCWRSHDYLAAVRYRGIAEGLEMAQANHFDVLHPERDGGAA